MNRFCGVALWIFVLLTFSAKAQYPADFEQVSVSASLSAPTAFAFAPDGRIFVTQQGGSLRVIKNGTLLSTPFVTLTVNSSDERGLLGVALDPDFTTNHYIYLYYTVSVSVHNRLSRFTADGDVAAANSELPILDLNPLGATNHNGGAIAFGPDGKLYVAVGENANGPNAQNLDNYLGKLLRINKDGTVPTGNPFTTGSDSKQRIWAYGLRNPYTFSFQPGTGKLFVNDVGQSTWEEINDATVGGGNYGWPTAEGVSANAAFVNPVYVYGHGTGDGVGCAITGGTFFNPDQHNYPAQYYGKYFFLDYCGHWINYIDPSTGSKSSFAPSISGLPVELKTGPDGNLYYLSRTQGTLYKIVYTGVISPTITQQPENVTINDGDSFELSVTATGTMPISYQWKFNGSDIPGATASTYSIAEAETSQSGNYKVVVSNSAGNVMSNEVSVTVTATVIPPAITVQPEDVAVDEGGSFELSVTATGTLPISYQWKFNGSDIPGATASTYSAIEAETSQSGNYKVTISNSGGSVTSDEVSVTVTPVLGVNRDIANAIAFYPNPSSSSDVMMRVSARRAQTISLFFADVFSRKTQMQVHLLAAGENSISIPTGLLSAGMNFVMTEIDGRPVTGKVIIVKQ